MQTARLLVCMAFITPATASAQTGAPKCPNILIVFDSSGSMNTGVSGAGSRFSVASAAVDNVVGGNDERFRFGLEMFGITRSGAPGGDGCGISSATCFHPTPGCESVAAAFNTAADISAVLDLHNGQGGTPTWLAVDEAAKREDMKDTSRPRFVLLVTDGDPEGCGASSIADGVTKTVASLNALRTNIGVKTFVLGFAGGSEDNLMRMAVAGGVPKAGCNMSNPTSCYYVATNAAQLQAALDAIITVVGGELGAGGACDESCYAQGCPAGQICKAAACVSNPCASKTCAASEVCVDGTCTKTCAAACEAGEFCKNGVCSAEVPCNGGCNGKNQICVDGTCQENYCSGQTYKITCPPGTSCNRNGCAPGGPGTNPDGGTSGGGGGQGCCSGAPGAVSMLGLVLVLSLLAAHSRRRAGGRHF